MSKRCYRICSGVGYTVASRSLHFTSCAFPGEGSAVRIRRLQKFLSSASSGTTRSSRMSRFTRSRHLPLGLPLGRLPGISMSITCLRLLSCSLRCTCPNHLSLLSLALLFILPTQFFSYIFTLHFVFHCHPLDSSQHSHFCLL